MMDIEAQCTLWVIEEMDGLTPEQIVERDRFLNETAGARELYRRIRGDQTVTIKKFRRRH